MNIWQRFKNWLIHKLGGKTKTEWENAVYSGLVSSQRAKKYKKNYEEEHEAYLALLNCHNAAKDYAKSISYAADANYIRKTDVKAMAKALKAYCVSRDDCDGCPLHGECGCKTADKACPEYWD